MKQELTEFETQMIDVIKNKWINLAFNGCSNGIDKEKFETGIEWLYDTFLKLPKPQVVYCDSLIDAVIKITLVKDMGKELSDFDPQMTKDFIENKLDKDFVKKMYENLSFKSSYIGWSNFGWVSFYDYFTNVCKIIDNENFNNYQKLIESNVFETFEFEHAVFAVKPPVKVIYNENNMAHNTEDCSIQFEDGLKYYFINGIIVNEKLFMSLYNRTYTVEDFFKEENEEVKSTVIAYIQSRDGEQGVYHFLKDNLKEIDTFVDEKDEKYLEGTLKTMNVGVYTLFKGMIDDIEIAYVRCYCPSTDRMFFLGVEPSSQNAKDAIASLFQVPIILKDKIKSISRQGEKFSIVFDEETTEKLTRNEFSVDELKKYTNISGDEYFSLMTYEY